MVDYPLVNPFIGNVPRPVTVDIEAVRALDDEGAYGLGKAKKKKAAASSTAKKKAAAKKKLLPEWAWALVAVGGIALTGAGVYWFITRRKR